jgi:hypothetical protein
VIQEPELPELTAEQIDALRRFAALEIGVDQLRGSLAGVFEIDFGPGQKTSTRFRVPEPGIEITLAHIATALETKRLGLISERELVQWATMLLLNDAYILDPVDEDFVAEWLNDISLTLDGS